MRKNVDSQINQKSDQHSSKVRNAQRQNIFQKIRKQFQFIYQQQSSKVKIGEQPKKRNGQYIYQQDTNAIDQFPLVSKTLQKFHSIPHHQIWKYISAITDHLIQNNVYLSEIMNKQRQESMQDQRLQIYFDEQSLLIHDLFYLTLEHENSFKFPRKFKFVRNGSAQVATYVSIVSSQILPDQLAYWMNYMNREDRSLTYININGGQDYYQVGNKSYRKPNLHYLCWVNHPILRNYLMHDFPNKQQAASAIKQLICYKKIHPDRFINNKGEYLYQILCKIFHQQLQGMIRSKQSESETDISFSNFQISSIYMQIALKTIEAKLIQNLDYAQLLDLLNKMIINKVQSQIGLISPTFCKWAIDLHLKNKIQLLRRQCVQIVVSLMSYDPNTYISKHQQEKCWCKKQDEYSLKYKGKICLIKFNQFKSYTYGENSKNSIKMQE